MLREDISIFSRIFGYQPIYSDQWQKPSIMMLETYYARAYYERHIIMFRIFQTQLIPSTCNGFWCPKKFCKYGNGSNSRVVNNFNSCSSSWIILCFFGYDWFHHKIVRINSMKRRLLEYRIKKQKQSSSCLHFTERRN